MSNEDILTAIGLMGAAIAFAIGAIQYAKAQSWKRAEWVAQEMDAFFRDPIVKSALQMLDWDGRRIQLYPERESYADRFVVVDDENLVKALQSHIERRCGFSQQEAHIRDIFDHLLDRLERLSCFVRAGLIAYDDVAPYLQYWAKVIIRPQARPGIAQLRKYIEEYGYSNVRVLLESTCATAGS